jgi:hypothetical protein
MSVEEAASGQIEASRITDGAGTPPMVEWALAYARQGWLVLLLHTIRNGTCSCRKLECTSPGKHPLTKNGLKDATNDPTTIHRWCDKSPDANIGIVTGRISGLFVLDSDGDEGEAWLRGYEAEHGALPETGCVKTGRGRHLYFKYPKDGPAIQGINTGKLDIKADGGYVVAAPSRHVTGRRYEVERQTAPADIEPEVAARLRRWVEAKQRTTKAAGGETHGKNSDAKQSSTGRDPAKGTPPPCTPEWVKFIKGALAVIPADCSYEEWRNRGMELHSLGWGEDGRKLFYEWSKTAKNQYSDTRWDAIWNGFGSYDGVPRTVASLIFEAQQRGYQVPTPSAPLTNFRDTSAPRTEEERAKASFQEHLAKREAPKKTGVTLEDFYAYMPMHTYIYMPTREPWPASSVNSRFKPVPLFGPDGNREREDGARGKPKSISASTWLDRNRAVEQMTWAPGEPEIIEGRLVSDGGWIAKPGCRLLNTYRPPIIVPGDPNEAMRWVKHVQLLYGQEAMHIIRFLAHRVQRPHEKINHALLLGGEQGIGKDTILEPVKLAVGPWNFEEVGPQSLLGRFNKFAKSVILRISEARDLGELNRYAFYEHMKVYTAAPPDVLRVDEKHLREYPVFNVTGVIITTNHKAGGIYLASDDRRHHVAWSNLKTDDFPEGYFSEMWGWYAEGGSKHVAAYLRELDLSHFDPKAHPPKTEAWRAIVDSSRPAEDAELADVLDKLDNPEVTTVEEVRTKATMEFWSFLSVKKNRASFPHRFEACGYTPMRNGKRKDGLWKIDGNRQIIYAKKELSVAEQHRAAQAKYGLRLS